MKKALVIGATGGMGSALVYELIERGIKVIAFARNERKLHHFFGKEDLVTIQKGDVFHNLSSSVAGAEIIFHAGALPYAQWQEQQEPFMRCIINAAKENKAKLVVVDNIYAYGRSKGEKVRENDEKSPHTKKGKIRLRLEHLLEESKVPYLLAHFPDFYGPRAENTQIDYLLQSIIKNKKAMFVGNQTIKREYIYTPDGAKALVELALCKEAYGETWNIPGYSGISGSEFLSYIKEYTNYQKRVGTATKTMVRLIGIFDRNMKEFIEMFYLNEDPLFLDGTKYEHRIGKIPRTPYKEGIKQTIDYMRTEKTGNAS
ncbi:NAD(P)H-binding protein [Priestia filamentosa]|uniref:NAD(P)H-binding protein n=1 Tax=Priestia filamentosa TaxID=1402861 RepID=UPI003D2D302E